jgi:hypothetical protein
VRESKSGKRKAERNEKSAHSKGKRVERKKGKALLSSLFQLAFLSRDGLVALSRGADRHGVFLVPDPACGGHLDCLVEEEVEEEGK